jgi:hypothetical protein
VPVLSSSYSHRGSSLSNDRSNFGTASSTSSSSTLISVPGAITIAATMRTFTNRTKMTTTARASRSFADPPVPIVADRERPARSRLVALLGPRRVVPCSSAPTPARTRVPNDHLLQHELRRNITESLRSTGYADCSTEGDVEEDPLLRAVACLAKGLEHEVAVEVDLVSTMGVEVEHVVSSATPSLLPIHRGVERCRLGWCGDDRSSE